MFWAGVQVFACHAFPWCFIQVNQDIGVSYCDDKGSNHLKGNIQGAAKYSELLIYLPGAENSKGEKAKMLGGKADDLGGSSEKGKARGQNHLKEQEIRAGVQGKEVGRESRWRVVGNKRNVVSVEDKSMESEVDNKPQG